MSSSKIAVVGGGIGGLAFARALSRLGFHNVKIYEKSQTMTSSHNNTGIIVTVNGMRVLDQLGVADEVYAQGQQLDQVGIMSPSGKTITSHLPARYSAGRRLSSRTLEVQRDTTVAIHRHDLLSILSGALPADSVGLETGHELIGLRQTDDERVQLKFKNKEEVEAELVIGADGLMSPTRNLVFPNVALNPAGGILIRGMCNVNDVASAIKFKQPHGSTMPFPKNHFYDLLTGGARFAYAEMGKGLLFWYATIPSSYDYLLQGSAADMIRTLNDKALKGSVFSSAIRAILDASSQANIVAETVYDLKPTNSHWYSGRAVFVGDSVHPLVPDFHQGASMALESALALALSLKTADSVPQALERYVRLRAPRIRGLVENSRIEWDYSMESGRLRSALRNMATGFVPQQVKELELTQLLQYDVLRDFPMAADMMRDTVPDDRMYFSYSRSPTFAPFHQEAMIHY